MDFASKGDIRHNIDEVKQYINNNECTGTYINVIIPEEEVWNILIQCLKGLHELHSRNIAHKDIKTANIFMYEDGTIKLGDFNVSLVLTEGLNFNQNGTPYYAAPEVWRGLSNDIKCDIWSLGCCIYEIICLHTPFHGENQLQLYRNVLRGKYLYPKYSRNYSTELYNIINLMLTVDSAKRPTAKDLLELDFIK